MLNYILNTSLDENPQTTINKNQKAAPISLLSGGNTFFIKIKSNQIASNYNNAGSKIKPYSIPKENNTFFQKEKNKSYNKIFMNNSQQKSLYFSALNNTIDFNYHSNRRNYNTKLSLIHKSKQDLFRHKKGIFSFKSNRQNDKINTIINSSSYSQNYNGSLIPSIGLIKNNNNYKIYVDRKNIRKNIKKSSGKYNNNTFNYKVNKDIIYDNNIGNSTIASIAPIPFNKKIKNLKENNTILSYKTKYQNHDNQIEFYKQKEQYILKNEGHKNLRNKNLTDLLFNNYSLIERTIKNKSSDKNNHNNYSEGKNKVIFHPRKSGTIFYNKITNNNPLIYKFNSIISSREIHNNKNSNSNFNTIDNSSLVNKKIYNIKKDNQNIQSTHNINNHKNLKLKNSFVSNDILNLNYTLKDLREPSPNNYKNNAYEYINNKDKSKYSKYLINKITEENNLIKGNKYIPSELSSNNINRNRNKNDKYPNIIINNNYLYNYMPLVTLNNSSSSRINNENKKQYKNTLIVNKNKNLYRDKKNIMNIKKSLNNSLNIKADIPKNYIYSSLIENNSKNDISNNMINKETKNKINKKDKKIHNMKINIIDSYSQNAYSNSSLFNYKPKFANSNIISNNYITNKTTICEYNMFENRGNSNNITECYVSKEKNNKKPKQNPPLSKNSKKQNITFLIKENNKKIKNNILHKNQIHSYVENTKYQKSYNGNICETIDYILHPENYKIKNDIEDFDNFDDMNTIIKRIDFENVDLKTTNIFTLNDEGNIKQDEISYLYKRYTENFNSFFEHNFSKTKTILSSKNKSNYNIYHSKQSGRNKESYKGSVSAKKI